MTKADQLIVRLSSYLEDPQRGGYSYYESWIANAEEENPGISTALRQAALELANSSEGAVLRSAIQALACVGTNDDTGPLRAIAEHADEQISSEASSALGHIALRHTPIEALLEAVSDRDSFVRFTKALAKEREVAMRLERNDPTYYCLEGALGWKNADIASFLYAGLLGLEPGPDSEVATWKTLGNFLYYGKIIE